MYGKIFHVVAIENPNNMAYTNLPLPYHQDLWYFFFKILLTFIFLVELIFHLYFLT